jgi:hypothetical protein
MQQLHVHQTLWSFALSFSLITPVTALSNSGFMTAWISSIHWQYPYLIKFIYDVPMFTYKQLLII